MWINEETLKTYKFVHEVRADFPEVSLPPALTDEMLARIGVLPVEQTTPGHNPITQSATELPPVLVDGKWVQQWEIAELFSTQAEKDAAIAADIEAKDLADAQKVRDKIEALWAAADRYVTSYISGVAIGILTIGVIQSKPKAMAVTGWSSAIWAEYYARKALVTIDSVDNLDYSTFGAMPYSVPEIQAEIGL